MDPLVSILIPAYNAERWIGDTLRSAIDQTWQNKEIIVVDDGSKDKTLEVAKRFESKTIKVETHDNMGACATRNRAFSLAQGDFIQWLDADDILHPDKISNQLAANEKLPGMKILFTAAWGRFFFCTSRARFEPGPLWTDLKPVDWMTTKFESCDWMNPTAWLVNRKLIEVAGLWDERLSFSGDDDGEYVCRLVSSSDLVKFVDSAKCYYRVGNLGSLNWSRSDRALETLALSIELSIGHLMALNNSERSRQASLMYLRSWIAYFYPNKMDMADHINQMALKIGESILPPKHGWKYDAIEKTLGWKSAKRIQSGTEKAGLLVKRELDRLCKKLGFI